MPIAPAGMVTRMQLVAELEASRLVAIVRADEAIDLVRLGSALSAGGVTFVELTMTTPGALDSISAFTRAPVPGVRIGAGTVLDETTARMVILAGADFIVSPTIDPAVIAMARLYDRLSIAGGLTPTEVLGAWRAGADVVKVFPGRVGTPEYFADLAGPLPQVRLMPTGNVDEQSAPAYLRAGAIAVGVGKAVVDPAAMAAGRFDEITERALAWRRLVDAVVDG